MAESSSYFLLFVARPAIAQQMSGGKVMKIQILLLCIIILAWVLSLVGILSDTIALLIMGVGAGILFLLSERKTE